MKASHRDITASLVDDRGIWTVKARVYDQLTGKVRQRTKSTGFKVKDSTKRKAEAVMKEMIAQWEEETKHVLRGDNPNFEVCVNHWLEHKKLTIRPNTLASYKTEANSRIIPGLGKTGVCNLTREDIQKYYEKMQMDGLSVSTMKKHRVIIRGALQDAVLDDLISTNVADNVKLPKATKFEGKALTPEQIAKVLSSLDRQAEPLRSAITLALTFGLRREEICGLRWSDIDLDRRTLHVCNTATDYAGTVYETESTKTNTSNRVLYIPDDTADFLKELKEIQSAAGIEPGKVCVWPDGKAVKPAYLTRANKKFLKSCGIDGVRFHDLRGTVGTSLAKTVPIKQVQEYLGHKDIQTTLKYYVHILDEDKIATANAMSSFLKSCSGNCSGNVGNAPDNIISFASMALKNTAVNEK